MAEQKTASGIRQAIFDAAKPKSVEFVFYGQKVELRQMPIKETLALERKDNAEAISNMILKFMYVPGTNDRVFGDADKEMILAIPFGPDMQEVVSAISTLTGGKVDEAVGNSEATQTS